MIWEKPSGKITFLNKNLFGFGKQERNNKV